MTVYTHCHFIMLPHWKTRLSAPWTHSVTLSWHWTNKSLPYPNNADHHLGSDTYTILSHWFDSIKVRTSEVLKYCVKSRIRTHTSCHSRATVPNITLCRFPEAITLYYFNCLFRTRISCHSWTGVLTITPPRLPDVITLCAPIYVAPYLIGQCSPLHNLHTV